MILDINVGVGLLPGMEKVAKSQLVSNTQKIKSTGKMISNACKVQFLLATYTNWDYIFQVQLFWMPSKRLSEARQK